MDVNLFSVALVHMQTLKAKDTVMQVNWADIGEWLSFI